MKRQGGGGLGLEVLMGVGASVDVVEEMVVCSLWGRKHGWEVGLARRWG